MNDNDFEHTGPTDPSNNPPADRADASSGDDPASADAAPATPGYPTAPYGQSYGTDDSPAETDAHSGAPSVYGPESYGPESYGPSAAYWSSPAYGSSPAPAYGPPPSYGPPPAYAAPTGGAQPVQRRRPRIRTALLSTAVLAALVGGGVGAGTVAAFGHDSSTVASGVAVTTSTAQNTATTDGTVSAAAAAITPSVVTISVTGQQEAGTGSGVVIRGDGYILTNDHVVSVAANGGSISVETSDGKTAKATIVGRDSTDDLAVIKVNGLSGLKAATFAKSSALKVGQAVVAVGAPLGLSDTVTSGIVSAKARPVRSGTNDQAVFAAVQTDAAINPGNSGGPLVDLSGNVVGINAAIATSGSGGVQVPGQTTQSGNIGIGFAIPADEASRVAGELIANGKATHAVLGITVRQAASARQQIVGNGATVASVNSGGPAASAGLRAGDVIIAVDGTRIDDGDSLIAVTRSYPAGKSVKVTYSRGGGSQTATVTLSSATS